MDEKEGECGPDSSSSLQSTDGTVIALSYPCVLKQSPEENIRT
jgi:hypothetical protein